MKQFTIKSKFQFEMIDITGKVMEILKECTIKEGLCCIFVPHTTAAITINENADPDVSKDIIKELDKIVPVSDSYRHIEGNSAAHIKASLIGPSETLLIENGSLILGTWQSPFFCEFDGPRMRKVYIKVITNQSF